MTEARLGMKASPLDGVAHSLAALTGWRRRVVLFLLGGLTTLALPPASVIPIVFLTLPPLVWMLEGPMRSRAAFGVGWWFGFGYFTVGWYWISNALLVTSDQFWWMIPFALFALPMVMALYLGLACWAARWMAGPCPSARFSRVLALIGGLALADLLRGLLFTGFPWNTFGYLWAGSDWLSQSAAWIGIYGMGVFVLASGLSLSLMAGTPRWRRWGLVALGIPLLIAALGAFRLSSAPDIPAQQADETLPGLRMVQPNIPQREKWVTELRARNIRLHLEDSLEDRPDWVQAVLWPETAATFLLERSPDYVSTMTRVVPKEGVLITGAPRFTENPRALYNAVYILADTGNVLATFDKFHLVPFGEYVPFADYLPFGKIAAGSLDYTPGIGPRKIDLPNLPPVGPLICYEVIFPGAVVDRQNRPDWLLNVTNDAWYGATVGPYQHMHHARMRAVEEGLPIVRPASTGVSAAFDAYGREIVRIDLNTRGYVDFRLPPPLAPTVFGQFSNTFALVLMVICLIGGRFYRPICVRSA